MLKRLSLYTVLLCLVPFFIWGLGYQWNGNKQLIEADFWLYLLTETGSVPYALITCAVLALLFRFLFVDTKQWIIGVCIMALAVIVTQGAKSGLKALFAEPRPFVAYLVEQTQTTVSEFYQAKRDSRAEIVHNFYVEKNDTPIWLRQHYENETGYSFPSGHAIFAATWLMLAVGFTRLLGNRSKKAKLLVGGLSVWALLMLISRIRLGMHYPVDLLAAIIVSLLVHIIFFKIVEKKAIFIKKPSI
ncbi:phosphatase PAP2 family protein [Rodentibacter caecimuris]|uniref:undecaprenyl-diphosphate phosphatase n=1 Tax=Rodentibacter caecimuris TaxID=1796644 RepID=A0ABX3KXE9_9PAST|nr:phosphatidylglycerophosphatase [Rodentibacter heylii]